MVTNFVKMFHLLFYCLQKLTKLSSSLLDTFDFNDKLTDL